MNDKMQALAVVGLGVVSVLFSFTCFVAIVKYLYVFGKLIWRILP